MAKLWTYTPGPDVRLAPNNVAPDVRQVLPSRPSSCVQACHGAAAEGEEVGLGETSHWPSPSCQIAMFDHVWQCARAMGLDRRVHVEAESNRLTAKKGSRPRFGIAPRSKPCHPAHLSGRWIA